jgi:hypothetical protein
MTDMGSTRSSEGTETDECGRPAMRVWLATPPVGMRSACSVSPFLCVEPVSSVPSDPSVPADA